MLSLKNVLFITVVLSMGISSQSFAKNGIKEVEQETEKQETESKAVKAADKAAKEAAKAAEKASKDAEKATKEATKASEKAAKDAAKAAKSQSRIELIAKMKQAELVDESESENEASLKYRDRDGKKKLTAEIEGFAEGEIYSMYIIVAEQEVLVSKLELVSDGVIPRQEIEFDLATWPTGVPTTLTVGMLVRVRSAEGIVVLEGSLQNK